MWGPGSNKRLGFFVPLSPTRSLEGYTHEATDCHVAGGRRPKIGANPNFRRDTKTLCKRPKLPTNLYFVDFCST
jgi:hypothetical protein